MMAVFDAGNVSVQDKLDFQKLPRSKNKDWDEGFGAGQLVGYDLGYSAAVDRYIPVDRE
ncbi:hypothetical protein ABIB99_004971 [Bradyrhizobium sp. LA6.1]|uniref:hypothetical protein n=1 Tax=Bradyrhizobium sp. LA6.1 TaxID=3156378 RepID=UPI00339AF5D6